MHLQVTEKEIQTCRSGLIEWLDKVPSGRGPQAWRRELQKMLLLNTVVRQMADWREVFQYAEPILMANYPDKAREIQTKMSLWLKKSPVEQMLKPKAYKWLQYLEKHPQAASWYRNPQLRVRVAHKVFCLQGTLKTFWKYLEDPSRRKTLGSIFSAEGSSSLNEKK